MTLGAAAEMAAVRSRVPTFLNRSLDQGVARSAATAVRFARGDTPALTRASRAFFRATLEGASAPSANNDSDITPGKRLT